MSMFFQDVLALAAIALSVFSLITYFWLGLTVLLLGNRGSAVTWVAGIGLLGAGAFFLCHGALVGAGVPSGPSATDLWWHMSWLPAFVAPALWAATGVHYAGLTGAWGKLRRPALLVVGLIGLLTAILALLSWPAIASYGDFIRLLNASISSQSTLPSQELAVPALPALGIGFVIYISTCACLPWASLVARRLRPGAATASGRAREPARTGDSALLWDAGDAWSRARPALLGASLLMMVAGVVVAVIGVLVLLAQHRASLGQVASALDLHVPPTQPGHVPTLLVAADLCVQLVLAGVGLTVGWAVVRQGVLVERRLPQRGYLSHWRGMALLALVLATVVAAMAGVEPEALPDLLLLVALVSAAYALFTWQSYVAHDRLLAQLRPFISSLSLGHSGWLATDPSEVERNVEALFTSLCRDVLGAAHGRLFLTAGHLHNHFVYTAPPEMGVPGKRDDAREWALPVSDERGVVARLVLGPRVDGAGYTSADLEVARACGQRILDAVGEFVAAQAVASLARQRGLESELSAALPRRVLHDDILPRLHLSMLKLESLRHALSAQMAAPDTSAQPAINTSTSFPTMPPGQTTIPDGLLTVVRDLGRAHHDLAALMRSMPTANPRRLEHGLVAAVRSALDGQFRGSFDAIEWEASDEACAAANTLPTILADLLLGATLEAIRNAGRHARGGDLHRHLRLSVSLSADAANVTMQVADDGVGLQSPVTSPVTPSTPSTSGAHPTGDVPSVSASASASESVPESIPVAPGTRTGLLTHGALMALVGGTLAVHSEPGQGTTVTVRVPRAREEALAAGTQTPYSGQRLPATDIRVPFPA